MQERVIEVLRFIKGVFLYFGELQIFGIHIDFVFHFFVPLFLVLILLRCFPKKKTLTIIIVSFLIVIKEVADIFGKSKIEYIRPPDLDLLLDISMGILGLFVGLYLAKKIAERRK